MHQEIEMTHDEQVKMYSDVEKSVLINMLIEANKQLRKFQLTIAPMHIPLCGKFVRDTIQNTSSASKCVCGHEKWEHSGEH